MNSTLKFAIITFFTLFPLIALGQNSIAINSKVFNPKQLHRDVDYALLKFEQIHPNFYREMSKEEAKKRFATLKTAIDAPMTRYEFMKLFSHVAFNIVRDGHNFTFGLENELKEFEAMGGGFFPLPVIIKNGRLYCNSKIVEIPFKAEITYINEHAASKLVKEVLSGYSIENDEMKELTSSNWFSSSLWYAIGGYDRFNITYTTTSGVSEVILDARSIEEIDSLRYNASKSDYEFDEIPELKTAVLKFNSSLVDLKEFRSFCEQTFHTIQQNGHKNLIIDIRKNLGGTTRAADILFEYITDKPVSQLDSIETKISKERRHEFIAGQRKHLGWFKWHHYLYYPLYIRTDPYRKKMMTAKNGTFVTTYFPAKIPKDNPLKFKGNLYLLTSQNTYSAANGLAAAFKCYELGPIIGQETGQPMISTADWAAFTLPNTKIRCAASVSRISWACGKDDGHGVIPDYIIAAEQSSDARIDPEMEYAKALILTKFN